MVFLYFVDALTEAKILEETTTTLHLATYTRT